MPNFITDYEPKFWVYNELVIYIFYDFSHKSHTMHLMDSMIMGRSPFHGLLPLVSLGFWSIYNKALILLLGAFIRMYLGIFNPWSQTWALIVYVTFGLSIFFHYLIFFFFLEIALYSFKAPKANAYCLFSTANVRKLRFYQNKGLSLDRCCGVPNTFPTRNQNSKLKNQKFSPIRIRLGKTTLFLSLGLVIKSNRIMWLITP